MDAPQLTNSVPVAEKKQSKLKLALAIALVVLSFAFLIYAAFFYGKTGPTGNTDGFSTNEPNMPIVSTPTGSDTPIPIESELTYQFPQAYGFEMKYSAADWTVEEEPTELLTYDPNTGKQITNGKQGLILKSTDPGGIILFDFNKGTFENFDNHSTVCSTNYKIIIDNGAVPIDGVANNSNKGLIRLYADGGGYGYAYHYRVDTDKPNSICTVGLIGIYTIDNNDTYWVVHILTNTNNPKIDLVDEMVKSIVFKGN